MNFRTAIVATLVLVCAPTLALAQGGVESGGPTINFTENVNNLLGLVFSALGAVLIWAAKKGLDALGIKNSASIMEQIRPILDDGLELAEKRAERLVSQNKIGEIQIENQKVADAVNHVLAQTPKWRKQAGLTEAQVEMMVRARLGLGPDDS